MSTVIEQHDDECPRTVCGCWWAKGDMITRLGGGRYVHQACAP
jgi:hypothetical protein